MGCTADKEREMREIKFRAWDGEIQRMLGPIECGEWTVEDLTTSTLAAMQYTGLKDKNGVEIFIGDILLLDLLSGDRHSEVIICEDREIPVVQYFAYHGWEPLHAYVGKPDTCLQVIGNIHEDPELFTFAK